MTSVRATTDDRTAIGAALPRWAILLLFALAARAITFGNPLVHVDEEFYFVTALRWLHGALPYLDTWDRKPVGLFVVYLPAAALGLPLGIWAYQAMALAAVVATASAIGRLARRGGWSSGALFAGIAYILWLNLATGEGGQAPIFYNLLMVWSAALVMPDQRQSYARGIAALALVGLALQVKYSAVFEGMFFGLWLMASAWRRGDGMVRTLLYGAAMVVVALLPTALAWGGYAAIGAGQEWTYANFTSILQRQPDPVLERVGNLAQLIAIVAPLVVVGTIGRRTTDADLRERQTFLRWWLGAALLGILVFGSWFDHYALPAFVPAAACAAGFFGDPRRRRVSIGLLLLVALIGQGLVLNKRLRRGGGAQLDAIAQAIGRGPGCLWVYSGSSMFYAATDRCAVTRYIFPSHLGRTREAGAIGVDQEAEVHAIFARKPDVVTVRGPYPGERADMRALVLSMLDRDYRLDATLPLGREEIKIFRRTAP